MIGSRETKIHHQPIRDLHNPALSIPRSVWDGCSHICVNPAYSNRNDVNACMIT